MRAKTPVLGLEITASSVRLAAMTGSGRDLAVLASGSTSLPDNMLSEDYAAPNIHDQDGFTALLQERLGSLGMPKLRRTAVSLPDSVFRVQILEFDDLPPRRSDRERLIRWRLEKSAAFDTADTLLRYQVLKRVDRGMTLLACAAKRQVIAQYETVLSLLGLEAWAVGLASLHSVDFALSVLPEPGAACALAYVTDSWFSTVVVEQGGARFYRHKEIKKGKADDVRSRIMRDIGDSLHFYVHQDRSQSRLTEVSRLSLAGDAAMLPTLPEELKTMTAVDVEVLSPAALLPEGAAAGAADRAALSAALLGAGGSLA